MSYYDVLKTVNSNTSQNKPITENKLKKINNKHMNNTVPSNVSTYASRCGNNAQKKENKEIKEIQNLNDTHLNTMHKNLVPHIPYNPTKRSTSLTYNDDLDWNDLVYDDNRINDDEFFDNYDESEIYSDSSDF